MWTYKSNKLPNGGTLIKVLPVIGTATSKTSKQQNNWQSGGPFVSFISQDLICAYNLYLQEFHMKYYQRNQSPQLLFFSFFLLWLYRSADEIKRNRIASKREKEVKQEICKKGPVYQQTKWPIKFLQPKT